MAVTFSASGTASVGGVQQAYAFTHDRFHEGQLSDIRDNTIGTYINETALNGDGRPGVNVQQVMNVANEGAVAVYVTGAVTPASVVRVLYSASGTGKAGQFSHAFASGKTVRLSNARYLTSTTSSGLAVLELNGPSFTLSADS